ncbi:MAG: nucleotidyltransferase domain-containing protein [Ktedonobacterales bacterium]
MGTELSQPETSKALHLAPWLDERTARVMDAISEAIAHIHPEVRAIILFGSVARHHERALKDTETSDVDLLLIVDPGYGRTRIDLDQRIAIHHTKGEVELGFPEAPRDVQITLIERDLADWDPAFIENVARDGVLLWAREPLPKPLAPVAERHSLQLSS